MQKIVVSVRDAIGTGGGAVAINTCKEMAKQGHKVVIVSDYPVDVEGCKNESMLLGSSLHKWNPQAKFLKILRHFIQLTLFSLWGYIKVRKYERIGFYSIDHNIESFGGDILVLHNIFLIQFLFDKRIFVRKILQVLNPVFIFRLMREYCAINFGKSKLVICVSNVSSDHLKYVNKKNKKNIIIENGVDLFKFKPISKGEKENIKNKFNYADKKVLLFVGHEFVNKRLDLTLETLSMLDESFILWIIGGRAKNRLYIDSLSEKYKVKHRVLFLGTIDQPQEFMAAADYFILLSDYETWGMVAVEALASGTPCIMTNVGCASSVIIDGYNGYIVNNAYEASNAIKQLDINSDKINYSSNCRSSVIKYSWKNITQKYIDALVGLKKL